MELPEVAPIRLNIGAGEKRFDGWTSVGFDQAHDIVADVRSIPVPDCYADEAMVIHVLEHLERFDAPAALAEWFRVLKPGGLLILELPDFRKCCAAFLRAPEDVRNGLAGVWGDPTARDPLMMHRWGWVPEEVRKELKRAGFTAIKERRPVFHGKRDWRDMRIEARRPA